MAKSYASRLKKGIDYGECGLPEMFDSERVLEDKVRKLAHIIKESEYMVAFTGAGISTSTGIPDFRGPNGVWTKELRGELEKEANSATDVRFETAKPSLTHMALVALIESGKLKFICSQNVDGLHLKSGVPPRKLAELHGNVFAEICVKCNKTYIREFDVQSIGLSYTGRICEKPGCKGKLRDSLLDWDDALPDNDYDLSKKQFRKADVVLCLGTSMRVQPAGKLPVLTVKNGGKMVVCNLQATPNDNKAELVIRARCDLLMKRLMKELGLKFPLYKNTKRIGVKTKKVGKIWSIEISSMPGLLHHVNIDGVDAMPGGDGSLQYSVDAEDADEKLTLIFHFGSQYSLDTKTLEHSLVHNHSQTLEVDTQITDYNAEIANGNFKEELEQTATSPTKSFNTEDYSFLYSSDEESDEEDEAFVSKSMVQDWAPDRPKRQKKST
jgi:NAD-dependent SIR2 family protein deacetylase